ncbi:NHL repeat protein [anaerobic digester metagenome]
MRLSLLCLCIALVFGCAALPATVAAAEYYQFSERWSFDEKDKGYLEQPGGITGDSQDRVYVVDRARSAVRSYSPLGEYLGRWGAPGSGPLLFNDPVDVSIDDLGRLYVADTGNGRVQIFTSGCDIIATWSGVRYKKPVDVAIVRKGKAYVADLEQPEILIADEDGYVDATIGVEGTGDGELRRPRALALDSGDNLLVLDESNARVTKFDRNGEFVLRFGSQGEGDGELNHPEGFALDVMDNIYVADTGNGRIVKYSPEGEVLAVFGARGSEDGEFEEGPYAVWVDSKGAVYVPDVARHGVQIFVQGEPPVVTPEENSTAPSDEDPSVPAGNSTEEGINSTAPNGTALNGTSPRVTAPGNETPAANETVMETTAALSLTPLPTITAVNITPYSTPTVPTSLPAPLAGLVGALVIAGVLASRRR